MPGSQARIRAMIEALHAEIHKVEGESSEFLVNAKKNAKKHVANISIHVGAQFTWLKSRAAEAEAKLNSEG
jgi:hypothetical protein